MRFTTQDSEVAFGTSISSGTTLTGSDVASTAYELTGASQIMVDVYYTPKTGETNRNLYVLPEFSYDNGTTYTALTKGADASPSSGEIATTLYGNRFTCPGATGGTQYKFRIPISAGEAGYSSKGCKFRVKCKEDGAANWGAATVIISISK